MENYLVNPVNPLVKLRHKPWVQTSFRRGKDGKFGVLPKSKKVKHVAKKRRATKKAKKHVSTAMVVKEKNPMMPLMLLNPRRRSHKVARRAHKAIMNPKKSKAARRRFHRNPWMPQMGETGKLILGGALIVAGAAGGSFALGKLSEKFPVLQKPMVRIGLTAGAGILTYVLLKKTKKVSPMIAASLATGVMLPALLEVKDMLWAKVGTTPAPQQVSYSGEELSAYVPEGMSAYVPEGGMGDYGKSY